VSREQTDLHGEVDIIVMNQAGDLLLLEVKAGVSSSVVLGFISNTVTANDRSIGRSSFSTRVLERDFNRRICMWK